MSFVPPPIVKASERLLLEVETVVRRFARYHKYSIGEDLRNDARTVARLAHRAWRDRAHQASVLPRLVSAVDDFKITLQLGSRSPRVRAGAHARAQGGRMTHPNARTREQTQVGKNLCPISRTKRGVKGAAASPWSKGPTCDTNRARREFAARRPVKTVAKNTALMEAF